MPLPDTQDHIQTYWHIGNTYRNDKQCATFIQHISQAQRHEIEEMVDEAKFVFLICDSSTDNSHTKAELAFVRYCHQGSIIVHFVGVKHIAKGGAQVIEVTMSTLFTDYFAGPSWEKKIVGTGTDGASTVLGKNNGFVAKLRQRLYRTELVAVHCSAHINELAYKEAARGIQLYKKVDALFLLLLSEQPPQASF